MGMCRRYSYVYDLCRDYLTGIDRTDAYITARPEEKQKIEDFIGSLNIYDDVAESNAIHHAIAEQIFKNDELIVHAAACADCGQEFGFIAPSGTGKTTHMLFVV